MSTLSSAQIKKYNAEGFIGVLVESDKPIAVNSGSITGSNANLDNGNYGQDVGIDQVVN